ncbi:MAG: GYD domain-containing protein [Dehalococcoidia bacterium]|nr:GYD domain-containing protein [Dehalococcoidia bacterium]
MAMYMTMVRFVHQEARGITNFCKEWQNSAKRIEDLGIKLVGSYGILGPYDMAFVFDAPDQEKAASVPLAISYLDPGIQTETWSVIPMEEFAELSGKVEC